MIKEETKKEKIIQKEYCDKCKNNTYFFFGRPCEMEKGCLIKKLNFSIEEIYQYCENCKTKDCWERSGWKEDDIGYCPLYSYKKFYEKEEYL